MARRGELDVFVSVVRWKRDFCGYLCFGGVRIICKLSCCGGSDKED